MLIDLFEPQILPSVGVFAYAPLSGEIYAPCAFSKEMKNFKNQIPRDRAPWCSSITTCGFSTPEKPIITFLAKIHNFDIFQQGRPKLFIHPDTGIKIPLMAQKNFRLHLSDAHLAPALEDPLTQKTYFISTDLLHKFKQFVSLYTSFDIYSDTSPVNYLGEVDFSRIDRPSEIDRARDYFELQQEIRIKLIHELMLYFKIV